MKQSMRIYPGLVIGFTTMAIFFVSMMTPAMASSRQDTGVMCRLKTDKDIFPAGKSQNIVLKISLDAPLPPADIQRPAVNISLVLDQSGSMNGIKIDQAKAAAKEAVNRLGLKDVFSLVTYNNTIRTIVPAQHPKNRRQITDTIRQIHASGNTALFGGVSQGAAEIRKNIEKDYVHRIVLLSDGLANVGPSTPEDLGRLGAALIKENISVTTVGVGVDYNEDLMARLSQKSDGNTYFVESGYDLPSIFTAELGDVLNVVAKKVKVIITLADDIIPVGIIGREGRINGNRISFSMNQLYGGQEKYALVEVKLPASPPGSHKKIARANVYYENPFTRQQAQSSGVSHIEFSSNPATVAASTNVDVVREYQLNLNALAQEKAIELSDKGQKKKAVAELKKSAVKLKELGGRYQDEILLEEADAIESQARRIEAEGMSKKSRKVLRTKSFQMKNQQILKE
ncbi:Ca-activated chloride channel family protein [Desulfocicer vacuolatum DSM 3385]|uniref:Ca-activated chloride channel family protein n=1 Tax=Desulfocicer vacuolatum DSM 3385 TaxID=1121400 RepID=A0A1W2BHE6_9BACT|nr:VWA domain-containing protein [Desulfocicer vacuolatum]SMC72301.1 Ca-activated chloride channel family protein [Desulfocicer vacuolatum DSM 3385]